MNFKIYKYKLGTKMPFREDHESTCKETAPYKYDLSYADTYYDPKLKLYLVYIIFYVPEVCPAGLIHEWLREIGVFEVLA